MGKGFVTLGHDVKMGSRDAKNEKALAWAKEDVALSLPAVVGAMGAAQVLEPEMSTQERLSLEHSADVLRIAAAELRTA